MFPGQIEKVPQKTWEFVPSFIRPPPQKKKVDSPSQYTFLSLFEVIKTDILGSSPQYTCLLFFKIEPNLAKLSFVIVGHRAI